MEESSHRKSQSVFSSTNYRYKICSFFVSIDSNGCLEIHHVKDLPPLPLSNVIKAVLTITVFVLIIFI